MSGRPLSEWERRKALPLITPEGLRARSPDGQARQIESWYWGRDPAGVDTWQLTSRLDPSEALEVDNPHPRLGFVMAAP